MIINLNLEIEDEPIPNRKPTIEEMRSIPTSYYQCDRCDGRHISYV